MADPLSDWLRLRESADFEARSDTLLNAVASALPASEALAILELGTGAGSNIRYLAERLGRGSDTRARDQRWLAVDRSAGLLIELPRRMTEWAADRGYDAHVAAGMCRVRAPYFSCAVETMQRDLRAVDAALFAGRHLVTASALLDLVPESWLRVVAAHCRAAGAIALFTITYNGRFSCTPADDEDEMVRDLFNRHQKMNTGFGAPATGPDAASVAERCLIDVGYRVSRATSDWRLRPDAAAMQRFLIEGWAQAATEMAPRRASDIANWRDRRLAHLTGGRSCLTVGHDDLAAL